MRFQQRRPDPAGQQRLIDAGAHPVLARVCAARGIGHPSDLDTGLERLLAPTRLRGIDNAAVLLAEAIAQRLRIVVIADYDCDGATACAVAVRGLTAMGAVIDYLVPNRFTYGYGLTPEIVALAKQRFHPDLIITVDNGIASHDGVAAARAQGMAVLITDHHLPAGNDASALPNANCIVNPNQPGCEFPSKHLAGVGVMFYVLLALRAELRRRGNFKSQAEPRLDGLLDLVALGTVADVVRLDANNRRLVAQGLRRMRAGRACAGIAALFEVAGRELRSASAADLGFAIGPRLNAAGRLADMSLGIEALVTDEAERAREIAISLDNINRLRRAREGEMQQQAIESLATLSADAATDDTRASLCLYDPRWHQGIVGILAGRLKERYHKPVMIFAPADEAGGAQSEGQLRGSGRSIAGLHLRDTLDLVSKLQPQLLIRFGGHAMAAGVTLRTQDWPLFAATFEQAVRSMLDPRLIEHVIEHDGSLADSDSNLATWTHLQSQVWGQGFPAPLFRDAFKVEHQTLLQGKHLKLKLRKLGSVSAEKYLPSMQIHEAIWFNQAEMVGATLNATYRLDANHFNNAVRLQLIIEHAEPLSPSDERTFRQ